MRHPFDERSHRKARGLDSVSHRVSDTSSRRRIVRLVETLAARRDHLATDVSG